MIGVVNPLGSETETVGMLVPQVAVNTACVGAVGSGTIFTVATVETTEQPFVTIVAV